MKPHRRKKTPPRRDPEAGRRREETERARPAEESAPEASEETYEGPEEVEYDPGQALAETEEVSYGDPGYQRESHSEGEEPAAYYHPSGETAGPGVEDAVPERGSDADRAEEVAGVYDDVARKEPAPLTPRTGPSHKRAVRTGASRRPGARGRAAAKGSYPKARPPGGGVTPMSVFLGLCAIAMLIPVVLVFLPRDLSAVQGYPADPFPEDEPRNLLAEAQEIMVSRDRELTFSEEEINTYLNERLRGQQDGMMAPLVRFRGVYADFASDSAEVIVQRDLFGLPLTLGARFRSEKYRGQVVFRPVRWSIGRLSFRSLSIQPVLEMYTRLRAVCEDEYHVLKMMHEVRFEEDRLVLDPISRR